MYSTVLPGKFFIPRRSSLNSIVVTLRRQVITYWCRLYPFLLKSLGQLPVWVRYIGVSYIGMFHTPSRAYQQGLFSFTYGTVLPATGQPSYHSDVLYIQKNLPRYYLRRPPLVKPACSLLLEISVELCASYPQENILLLASVSLTLTA